MTAPLKQVRFAVTSYRWMAALSALALVSTACRSTHTPKLTPPPSAERLQALQLFEGETGKAATWQQLEAQVDGADVVVIGELHGHPLGLPYATLLYQGSLDRNPETALALEFVSRDLQYALDAYSADLIDYDSLQDAVNASRGSTVKPHGPMIEASREAGRPIYAANAPRIYTTAARKKGYETLAGLNAEQKRLFDIPDPMPGPEYRQRFFDFMNGGHDPEPTGEEAEQPKEAAEPTEAMLSVFRSQALWDGTMSSTTSKAVEDGNKPVFLVVGQFHCDSNGGTLELLRLKQPNAKILVVSVSDVWSDELLEDDMGKADFIVFVGPFPEED
jgi:uncharacterized iron-regulated protein